MIFHLIVGSVDFTPTGEDLQKAVEEFKKETPILTMPVKVVEIRTNDIQTRMLINIESRDWSPTDEEIEALRKQFEAAYNEDYGIVATRQGVKVTMSTYIPKRN